MGHGQTYVKESIDTLDSAGQQTATMQINPHIKDVKEVTINSFLGEQYLILPKYSAQKCIGHVYTHWSVKT